MAVASFRSLSCLAIASIGLVEALKASRCHAEKSCDVAAKSPEHVIRRNMRHITSKRDCI
jgi:hypothetical protein